MNKFNWYNDFEEYYYENNRTIINKHHFESYNDFLYNKINEIINDSFFKIESLNKVINIVLSDIYFTKPLNENMELLLPNECRLKNLNYFLIMKGKLTVNIKDKEPIIIENFDICEVPLQVLSNECNLYEKINNKRNNDYKYELYKNGECINELGGYFIINGKEKVIVSQERLAYNKLYTHKDPKYILITEVKSQKRNSFIPAKNTYVKLKNVKTKKKLKLEDENESESESEVEDNIISEDINDKENTNSEKISNVQIYVSFPGVSDIPLFIIFRALGYESDKKIFDFILQDLLPCNMNNNNIEIFNEYSDIYNNFANYLEDSRIDSLPITDKFSSLDYIYSRLDNSLKLLNNSSIEDKRQKVVNLLLSNFLPHQPTLLSKCMYLGYMTFNLLKIYLGYDNISNRDTYEYKQVETSGYLLSTLFREYYVKFKNNAFHKINQKSILDIDIIKDIYTNNNFKEIKNLFFIGKDNILTNGFLRAFKGNWGVRDVQKTLTVDNMNEKINRDAYSFNKEGIVQDLLRISYLSTITHLRRIQTPLDSNVKIAGPRRLNATQYGFICPVDTPDGGNSGIIKNLSIGTIISQQDKNIFNIFIILFNNLSGFISYINNYNINPSLYFNYSKIFIDGIFIGIYINDNILNIINYIKLAKTNFLFNNNQFSIAFNYEYKELYIYTDFGRCLRPLYILKHIDNKYIIHRNNFDKNIPWNILINGTLTDIERIKYKDIYLNNLNNISLENISILQSTQAPIEFIDPNESLYTLIAQNIDIINNTNNSNYQYLEIDAKLIFGALHSIIPFMNHIPYTRSLFCMAQAKQAVGIFASNFNKRMDTFSHVLYYPQTPIVNTKISSNINYNNMPGGCNVVIAIATYTGYNQEDAVIFNKSALDRGLFLSAYYRTYTEYLENDDMFSIPNSNIRKNGNNYNKLQTNGIIKNNTYIDDTDIIIGRTSNNNGSLTDTSITIHHGDFGRIDGIYSNNSNIGNNFVKVRVRMERTPNLADKFGSRMGLKGTIGAVLKQEDMPFTKDGIVPDIIINPHGIPSRMSTGHLIEMLTGKVSSLLGGLYDASPFENENELENIINLLKTLNFESYGNEILTNGYTGEQIESSIFTGVQFYQRLKHMVHDKIQSRDTGPKTLLERQPTKGRARGGGLRCGEMERDSIISHGMSNFLKESYTVRSDNYKSWICKMCGRIAIANPQKNIFKCNFCSNTTHFDEVRIPYCTKLFIQECETQSIALRLISDKY